MTVNELTELLLKYDGTLPVVHHEQEFGYAMTPEHVSVETIKLLDDVWGPDVKALCLNCKIIGQF